jgi:hypothetical protein
MRDVDKLTSATRSEKSIVSILAIGVADRSGLPFGSPGPPCADRDPRAAKARESLLR